MATAKSKLPDTESSGGELLAWNLRKYRSAAGISQDQLGQSAGVDRTYVSRLERAIENPSLAIVEKLATALGVHLSVLLQIPDPAEDAPRALRAGRKVGYRRQNPAQ